MLYPSFPLFSNNNLIFFKKMFTLILFAIIFVIIIYYVRKINKIPKEIENVPFTSTLPVIWALLRSKPHDEIQDIIHKSSGGHDIYLVCHIILCIF